MKNQNIESELESEIDEIIRSYIATKGGRIGYKENPDSNQQGVNPIRNGRPFDLLFEIDSRLLMLEVKVQTGKRKFNDLGEERRQMFHLKYLWGNGVKVYYGFNLRIPRPNYWEYQDRSVGISEIAGISPDQMRSYIDNKIELHEPENSLKALIDSEDSGDALPKVLHDWKPRSNGGGHTTTYLVICYNTRLDMIQSISQAQFDELINIFHRKIDLQNATQEIPRDIVEKVIELREAWDRDIEMDNSQEKDNSPSL